MNHRATLSATLMVICMISSQISMASQIIMDIEGYPLVFELNIGESHSVNRSYSGQQVSRKIEVLAVKHFYESNLWIRDGGQAYAKAEVKLNVSGQIVTLIQRPYQLPATINGLRIYVESTRDWAENAEYGKMEDFRKDVRLSVALEGEPWGPVNLLFLVQDYRWRASAYNNTWSALVPYNKLYYHRGEDYGAIPDKLNIISPFDGEIIATPLPRGDGASNAISIRNKDGIVCRFSHMNIESIDPKYTKGSFVKAGTVLAKTGMTWGGRKAQTHDPHIHIGFSYGNALISAYPYLMEAYTRMYQDPVLAIAGGYKFALVDEEVFLDGSRSYAGKKEITSYTWKLHDGRVVDDAQAVLRYKEPGLYSEELLVTSHDGETDRDFVQVRVFDPQISGRDIGYGWAYYYPVRNIKRGTRLLFWNRLIGTVSPVIIDFGDGTQAEIDREVYHSYKHPGNYVVTLTSKGPHGEPLTVKLEVVVEETIIQ